MFGLIWASAETQTRCIIHHVHLIAQRKGLSGGGCTGAHNDGGADVGAPICYLLCYALVGTDRVAVHQKGQGPLYIKPSTSNNLALWLYKLQYKVLPSGTTEGRGETHAVGRTGSAPHHPATHVRSAYGRFPQIGVYAGGPSD
jgi:hypothetical protein